MSGPFDTLIYTDCKPGMGLSGAAGMQFQARSLGVDENAMTLVRNNLLYEAPTNLMQERRPLGDYPPSFAHICDGIIATAAGVYLGRGVSSGREGNQLTHAIVTRDPAHYGFVRPAQLFGAPFWLTRPASSTNCEPIPAGWTSGPFDATQAQRFVKGEPGGGQLLCSLVSVLLGAESGDHETRRIVFVAREVQSVIAWLTAATLLLPQRRALAIGFKVFTANPAFSRHDVVAVHPDWGTFNAALDNDLGYMIVDLIRREWTEVAISPQAKAWTDLFLAEDPYDVVDAVEFVAFCGLEFDSALPVALAAIMGRLPDLRAAEMAVSWLEAGPRDLVLNYAGTITGLLVDSNQPWPTELLLKLDRAGSNGVFHDRRKAVRLALLDAALLDAVSGEVAMNADIEQLPPSLWTAADDDAAAERVVAALKAARVEKVEAVLRVAGSLSLPLRSEEIHDELRHFIAYWAQRPMLPYRPELWPCQDEILNLLRRRLSAMLEANPLAANQIGEDWWHLLFAEPFLIRSDLDAVVLSTAMCHLPEPQRLEMVQVCLDAQQSVTAIAEAASRLWSQTPPTAAEARLLTAMLPAGTALPAGAFAALDRQLSSGQATAHAMDVGDILRHHGIWQPSRRATRVWEADRHITKLCSELRSGQAVQYTLGRIRVLCPMPLLLMREPRIQDALIKSASAASVLATLKSMPWLTLDYQESLVRHLSKGSDPVHIVMAFVLTRPQHLPDDLKRKIDGNLNDTLERVLRNFVIRASQDRRDAASAQIRNFTPPFPEEWRSLLHKRRGWRRLWPKDKR